MQSMLDPFSITKGNDYLIILKSKFELEFSILQRLHSLEMYEVTKRIVVKNRFIIMASLWSYCGDQHYVKIIISWSYRITIEELEEDFV